MRSLPSAEDRARIRFVSVTPVSDRWPVPFRSGPAETATHANESLMLLLLTWIAVRPGIGARVNRGSDIHVAAPAGSVSGV